MTIAIEPPAASPTQAPFRQDCGGGEMAALILRNAILTILTLGLYRFWAMAKTRRLLWSNTFAWGDSLEYTGTGGEMFKGFLFVLLAVFLPVLALQVAANTVWAENAAITLGSDILVTASFTLLVPYAIYRARRYRLSRTLWRGIRGGMSGSAWGYVWRVLGWNILKLATLGLVVPLANTALTRFEMSNTRFGNRNFEFEGEAGKLYGAFFKMVLWVVAGTVLAGILGAVAMSAAHTELIDFGGMVTMALSGFWVLRAWCGYKAVELGYFAQCTRFAGAGFRFEITGGKLFWLLFPNLLIVLFTLGLAKPYAALRSIRFATAHLTIIGQPDFAAIAQNRDADTSRGEGMASFLGTAEF